MKKVKFLLIVLFLFSVVLVGCVEDETVTPWPTVTPFDEPTETATPERCDSWILEVTAEKAAVLIGTERNESGAVVITTNTGVVFAKGERVQFCFPCIVADGSVKYCEVLRDMDGNYYPADRYVKRDLLGKVE